MVLKDQKQTEGGLPYRNVMKRNCFDRSKGDEFPPNSRQSWGFTGAYPLFFGFIGFQL